jgi:phage terminase large subunit-like protein
MVLILTPWSWDDLRGRVLREYPGEWRLLHIPAQADPEILDPDPLGRQPGEFMISARGRSREQWEKRKREAGEEWTPLYQGAPAAPGGTMFDVERLRYWSWNRDRSGIICGHREWRLRHDCWIFITMDLAYSTKRSADWTVASCWAIPTDGSLVLLDTRRARVPEHQQIDVARPLVDRYSPEAIYVEAQLRGTQLIREAVAEGWQVRDLIADRDKTTRAAGAARRMYHGLVWWPSSGEGLLASGEDMDGFVEEVRQFPQSRFDDQVDTLAYADRVRFTDYVPPPDSTPPGPSDGWDPLAAATDVMPGFNPETAAW